MDKPYDRLDGVIWYVPNGDIRTVGNDTETITKLDHAA